MLKCTTDEANGTDLRPCQEKYAALNFLMTLGVVRGSKCGRRMGNQLTAGNSSISVLAVGHLVIETMSGNTTDTI